MRFLTFLLVFVCLGCGVKGPPLPPETAPEPAPADVSTQPTSATKKGS